MKSHLATKMKANTVVGRGEKSLLIDRNPGSELRGGDRRSSKIIKGMNEQQKKEKKTVLRTRRKGPALIWLVGLGLG